MPMFANSRGYLPSGSLQAELADRDAAVEDARLEGAVEGHDAVAQLQPGNVALQRALELRPAESAREQGDADRPYRRIEAHVHLVGAGVAHAQRVDREPAVEDRDRHGFEQAEMPACRGERQGGGAELEPPEPAGVPLEPRLEQRIVDAAGELGARGIVEPVEAATQARERDVGRFAEDRDVLELERRANRQVRLDLDVAAKDAAPGHVAKCAVDQERLRVDRQRIRDVQRLDPDARVRQERAGAEVEGARSARAQDARVVQREFAGDEAQRPPCRGRP